jgi:single-strand DNA-binding protein
MEGNTTTVVGNITADPELKYVGTDGIPVVNFSIARSWKIGPADNQTEKVAFFNVVVWREMALHLAASVRKGDRLVITGTLEHRTWKAEDGTNRHVVEIKAAEVAPSLRFAVATLTPTAGRHAGEVREMAMVPAQPGSDPAQDLEDLGEEPF